MECACTADSLPCTLRLPGGPWEPGFGASPADRRAHLLEGVCADPAGELRTTKLSEEEQEVIQTVEETFAADEDMQGSRRKFQEWCDNFDDKERQFSSPMVLCEVTYNEMLEFTAGWPEPNVLKTATCSLLFDKLVPCYAMKRDSLLERLKNNLLFAVYSDFTPKVAVDASYFKHTPFFVTTREQQKRQAEFDRVYNEIMLKEQQSNTGTKVVKSVNERSLENLRFYLQMFIFKSWHCVVLQKHELMERLRTHLSNQGTARMQRQLFQDWKVQAVAGHLFKMGQNILYLEEQIEYLAKDNPDKGAEAKAKAASLVKDVDDIDLEEMLNKAHEEEDTDEMNAASRRSLNWFERLKIMYHDAAKSKPSKLKTTLDCIAEIYAAKMKLDAEQDKAGEPRQPLPDFCHDHFLMLTGVGSNASKRLCELIAGVRKHSGDHPRIKTFGLLMNVDNEAFGFDPQAVSFLLCALSNVVPDWLVLSRLFQENVRPTIGLDDALKATETAFASTFALGQAPLEMMDRVRELASLSSLTESDLSRVQASGYLTGTAFVRVSSSLQREREKSMVVLLDSWLQLLLDMWMQQLQRVRTAVVDLLLREQAISE